MPYQKPELDILTYLPRAKSMSQLDHVSHEILMQAGSGPKADQIHLATYVIQEHQLKQRGINITQDATKARILRSVLMKPEHEIFVPKLHAKVESLASALLR